MLDYGYTTMADAAQDIADDNDFESYLDFLVFVKDHNHSSSDDDEYDYD